MPWESDNIHRRGVKQGRLEGWAAFETGARPEDPVGGPGLRYQGTGMQRLGPGRAAVTVLVCQCGSAQSAPALRRRAGGGWAVVPRVLLGEGGAPRAVHASAAGRLHIP